MSTEAYAPSAASSAGRDDLERYRQAAQALEATKGEIEELEQTEAFEVFQKQLGLLRRRLLMSPQSLRQMFIDDGMQAIVWEFKQDALGRGFTKTLWSLLLRDDDASAILLRFVWNLPRPRAIRSRSSRPSTSSAACCATASQNSACQTR
jgi:glutamate synthase (NADPH) small chain